MSERNVVAAVLVMVREKFTDLERHYLIDRYRMATDNKLTNNRHRMIVGRAYQLVSEMLANGATANELDKAMEYIMVTIDAQKFNLDFKRAHDDLDVTELWRKYLSDKTAEARRKERARKLQLERATTLRGVLKLHAEGKTNEQIAQELNIPEATVRFFLRKIEKAEKEKTEETE